jgi:hypothetical protein
MNVKLMLSGMLAASCTGWISCCRLFALLSITLQQKRLDKIPLYVVIIVTAAAQPNRENENAAGEKQLRQAEGVTATRDTQPPPARCAPSFVPGQRILRSQRLATGEIRDATTGPCGQAGGFPNGPGVWFLPPVILPSGICFRARWFARITSPEAWSEKRTQAHSGGDEVRGRATSPEAINGFRSAGRTGAAQLPRESASPKHRAAASAGKKTPISLLPELRRQLLNGQRGSGLVLFMRRGMREWMTACSPCLAPPPTKEFITAADEAVLPHEARTEVVLILAGMLLHGCQERVS